MIKTKITSTGMSTNITGPVYVALVSRPGFPGNPGADGIDSIFTEAASQAEAEAGTDNTKGMTPLRVVESIAANETDHSDVLVDGDIGVTIQKVNGKQAHSLITTSATLNATTATEHTGTFTDDWTLTLDGFTDARRSLLFMFSVTGGGAPSITLAGYTINWPADVSETLASLVDGDHEAIFSWNPTTGEVTARAQKVDA